MVSNSINKIPQTWEALYWLPLYKIHATYLHSNLRHLTSADATSNVTDFAASTAAMPTTTEASEESLRELQEVIHTPEHQMEMEMVEDVRHKGIESEKHEVIKL